MWSNGISCNLLIIDMCVLLFSLYNVLSLSWFHSLFKVHNNMELELWRCESYLSIETQSDKQTVLYYDACLSHHTNITFIENKIPEFLTAAPPQPHGALRFLHSMLPSRGISTFLPCHTAANCLRLQSERRHHLQIIEFTEQLCS